AQHSFGKRVGVIARLRAVSNRAMPPDGTADAPHAGTPCSLLPPRLLAAAAHFAAAFGFVSAATLAGQVLLDRFPKQTLVGLGAEDFVGDLEVPHRLPFKVFYFNGCHVRPSAYHHLWGALALCTIT